MRLFIFCAASIYVISILWIVWLAFTAPEGYQDDSGFHLNNPRIDPAKKRKGAFADGQPDVMDSERN